MPLWLVFAGTIAVVVASIEVGYRLGGLRRRSTLPEKDAPVGAIVAATLGLLAFMLAFTFGLAASRFDARRMLVLEEANAIGTAYLRANLVPEPQNHEIRKLLRDYVDVRLKAVQAGRIEEGITQSSELQNQLWAQTGQLVDQDSRPIVTGLLIQSLNNVIDLHGKRVMFALHNRIPEMVWLVLYAMAILAMSALGYQEGLSGSRRSLAVLALALTFSAVIFLIADLDRPQEGLLRVGQRALTDLRDSLAQEDAAQLPPQP